MNDEHLTLDEVACRDLVELITRYLEAALPQVEKARFERHLADCPECDAYLEQMRLALRVAAQADDDELPQPALRRLLQVFRDWKDGERG